MRELHRNNVYIYIHIMDVHGDNPIGGVHPPFSNLATSINLAHAIVSMGDSTMSKVCPYTGI